MTGWLGSSVVECLRGQPKALGSSEVEPQLFTCYTYFTYYMYVVTQI